MSIGSFLNKIRRQKAVWWRKIGTDGYGKTTFDDPVEIDCRWEDMNDLKTDDVGAEVEMNSRVIVDREISEGDWLKLGEIDSNTLDDPTSDPDAYEVDEFNNIPDLKNDARYYEAIL